MTDQINQTGLKSFDRFNGPDSPFTEIFTEVEDGTRSYWGYLRREYWNDNLDCRTVHEWTVKDFLKEARYVRRLTEEELEAERAYEEARKGRNLADWHKPVEEI